MAKIRSPNYPSLDLGEALEAVRPALKAENRNKFSRLVLAQHLGYTSLNGRALGKIGAIRAYGLVDGNGDELRLSDHAIAALEAPEGSEDRLGAMLLLADHPPLFQEITAAFEGLPSEKNLHFWLVKRGFTSDAASKAVKNYLATTLLASGKDGQYKPSANAGEKVMTPSRELGKAAPPHMGNRQAVFPLTEGEVTLSFPSRLSLAGYNQLSIYLETFLQGLKGGAEARERLKKLGGENDDGSTN
jgi:hypothetical protein